MKIYTSWDDMAVSAEGSVVTVGNFDGVHLGHQAIIKQARQLARQEGLPLIGVTFDPAPANVLHPGKPRQILTSREVKVKLLEEQGMDQLLILSPSVEFLSLSAEEFVKNVLIKYLMMRHIVEGPSFSFGRDRQGSGATLKEFGRQLGFSSCLVSAQAVTLGQGEQVIASSTLIRQQIIKSQFENARQCLGYYYMLPGRVVSGRGIGREIGYPTVNLQPVHPEQLAPGEGVFSGYARWGDDFSQAWQSTRQYAAAISIGRRETFAQTEGWAGDNQIEAYLLDWPSGEADIRGKYLILSFVGKIRGQRKFTGVSQLQEAIEQDCQVVRDSLMEKGIVKQ